MKKYYIAYGSNLNIEQMEYRCPNAKIVGTSVIQDYELLYKGSKTGSYLTIEKKEGSVVPVGIWEVTLRDEFLLDRYEGYPDFYYKKEMVLPVKIMGTELITDLHCFVYIMDEDRKIGLPRERYIETCKQGYSDFGFDIKYLDQAYERSVKGVDEK